MWENVWIGWFKLKQIKQTASVHALGEKIASLLF